MGDPLSAKQVLKFGLEVINPNAPQSITGTIDTEIEGGSIPFSLVNGNAVLWINNFGAIVQWENNSLNPVEWIRSGYGFLPQDVQTTGRYVGVTLNGSSASTIYAGLHLQFEHRAQWPQGGAQ
jgi:hypothetical protein